MSNLHHYYVFSGVRVMFSLPYNLKRDLYVGETWDHLAPIRGVTVLHKVQF